LTPLPPNGARWNTISRIAPALHSGCERHKKTLISSGKSRIEIASIGTLIRLRQAGLARPLMIAQCEPEYGQQA
jgi:hypothetical protein